jgi:hypothetical protein
VKIHVPTKTIFSTDKHAYSRGEWSYRQQSGGLAADRATVVWADWDIYDYIVLPVDSATEKPTRNLVDTGGGVYAYTVIQRSPQEIEDRTKAQLDTDLQQATISSAILITEVFNLLYDDSVLNVQALSDKAKAEFATLQALVDQYTE